MLGEYFPVRLWLLRIAASRIGYL